MRKVLKQLGFSWKKAHKLLNKGKPDQRAAFLERLQGLLADALHERCLLIYIDEAHIHLDTDAGYGWAIRGEWFWVSSSSPGRAKVSRYGVYLYNLGQVRIFADDKANQDHTVDLEPLPAYSPDLMPVEHLWQWLREDVTYHACYATASELKQRVEQFQHQINATPLAIADRLWVKNHLDPEEEKLRVST